MSQDEFIGDYHITRRLGAGGQATTWLATTPDGDEVLIKVFHVEIADDWKVAELFERSANVLETIDHPNIPGYRDHFEFEEGHTIKLCLVRDFVEGESLQEIIDDGGSFSEDEVIELAIQLLEILDYLHQKSPPIVHRDIKPANVILGPDKRPYLVDFGAVQADVMTETGGSTVVGTAGYVAPEQLMGRAEPSSDIYALGISLVHLLTRKPPTELPSDGFELDYADELVASPQLKYVLGRMTRADINERDDSAADLLEKFRTLASGGDIVVRSSTLPVKVPRGSELHVVETPNSIIVRTPRVLVWDSSPWRRRARLVSMTLGLLFSGFIVLLMAAQSPAFGWPLFIGLLLLIYILHRVARPLEIELGSKFLRITQPPLRMGHEGEHISSSDEWAPYIRSKETRVTYDEVKSVDFAPVQFGGTTGSNRVMRLNCTSKVNLAPPSLGSHMLRLANSDSYLLDLGLSQGEEIWLAKLINARLAQHREMQNE